jgi:DNA polymerase-3 subunit epsilon
LGGSDDNDAIQQQGIRRLSAGRKSLSVVRAAADELELHDKLLEIISKKSGNNCLWKQALN